MGDGRSPIGARPKGEEEAGVAPAQLHAAKAYDVILRPCRRPGVTRGWRAAQMDFLPPRRAL